MECVVQRRRRARRIWSVVCRHCSPAFALADELRRGGERERRLRQADCSGSPCTTGDVEAPLRRAGSQKLTPAKNARYHAKRRRPAASSGVGLERGSLDRERGVVAEVGYQRVGMRVAGVGVGGAERAVSGAKRAVLGHAGVAQRDIGRRLVGRVHCDARDHAVLVGTGSPVFELTTAKVTICLSSGELIVTCTLAFAPAARLARLQVTAELA
jgi:hypothetical protein